MFPALIASVKAKLQQSHLSVSLITAFKYGMPVMSAAVGIRSNGTTVDTSL